MSDWHEPPYTYILTVPQCACSQCGRFLVFDGPIDSKRGTMKVFCDIEGCSMYGKRLVARLPRIDAYLAPTK